MPGGTRPSNTRRSGTRPQQGRHKYGAHTREVTGARRYGTGRAGRTHPNGRNPGDVWSIPTRPYRGPHFAAFPIDLPTRCIAAGCKPGGTVLDMFCGTGTTGLAALALGRRFTGIELNPAFAALAAERLRHAAEPDPGEGAR
jgi:DNA modification methylase